MACQLFTVVLSPYDYDCPSLLDLGKNQLRDENGKGTMGCTGMGSSLGLVWAVRGRERGDEKTCFSAGRAAHVHDSKNIRQGSLRAHVYCLFVRF